MIAGPAELATGPEQGLARSLKPRHVEMIAIGGIIGAGLFVGSSSAIAAIGPAAIVSYAAAGLIVLLVMRMLSEMANAVPGVQSFPEFSRLGLGDWAGFLSGWLYWYFWVVVVAIEAIAGATIVCGWWPVLPVWAVAFALTLALTGVNLLSARSYGEFEFWLSGLKITAILVFILVAIAAITGVAGAGTGLSNWTAHGGFAPHGALSVVAGVTNVIFALVGAEIATVAAAESSAGPKVIAKLTLTVAARILLFYVVSIALIVAVVPWTDIIPGESPFATALARIGVPGGALIMQAVVLVAVLSCLNSGLYVTSRVLHALAMRGDAPRGLALTQGAGVPRRAILFGTVFSLAALTLSIVSPTRAFAFLVNASGAVMLVLYLLIALAQLRLRTRLERESPERLTIRMWWHPYGAIAAILAIVGVLAAMALTPALETQFRASALAVLVALAGLVLKRAVSRRPAPTL
ncbi:amino acid permease [Sphingomonas sp. TX0543]|uniref:amino acid permease n=1 Tax=unclassified Sphingomonas TaxID=196159 RepID=UPI0010F94596|nr:amino acid permease [Sphingomonas sp. 3P27F8]